MLLSEFVLYSETCGIYKKVFTISKIKIKITTIFGELSCLECVQCGCIKI